MLGKNREQDKRVIHTPIGKWKSEVNNGVSESSLLEVKQDLDTVKTAFKRVMEALVMIKTDTANMLKRDSTSDKFSGLLSEFRNAQLQNFESQKNLLERFTATETRNLQQVVEKVEMLSASVKGRMSKPDKVRHLFVFDLASKPTWALLMVNMFLFAAFGSALYFARQPDYDRIDNDLKYRYIKMKGEASPEQLMDLEDVSVSIETIPKSTKCVMMWKPMRMRLESKQLFLSKHD